MAQNYYEGMFLLDSGRFAANPDGTSAAIVDLLEKSGGTLIAHRPWQDGRLAYEIEGQRKALHFLTYFRMEPAGIKPLTRACKLSNVVLRHLVIKQPQVLFDAMVAALTGETESSKTENGDEASSKGDSADGESGVTAGSSPSEESAEKKTVADDNDDSESNK